MDSLSILLVSLLFGLVAVPWAIAIRNREIDYFNPIVYHSIFTGMLSLALADWLLLSPNQSFRWDVIPWGWREGLLIAGTALTVMFASTLVGYYALGPRVMEWARQRGLGVRATIDELGRAPGWLFRTIGGLYMLGGVVAFALTVIVVYPGFNVLWVFDGMSGRSRLFEGMAIFQVAIRTLPLGYALYLCGALVERRTPSALELMGIIPVAGITLLTGSRGRTITSIIVVVILCYYATLEPRLSVRSGGLSRIVNRLPSKARPVVVPALGLTLAPSIILLRWLRRDQPLWIAIQQVDLMPVLTAGVHENQLENFLALVSIMPEEIPFHYGAFYLRAVANFVPRALWPGKPVATSGGVLYRSLGGETGGKPPGAIGDAYINFGAPGLVIVGLVFGVVLYLLYQLVQRRGRGQSPTPLAVMVFAIVLVSVGGSGPTTNAIYGLLRDLVVLTPALALIAAVRTGVLECVSARVRSSESRG